MSNSNFYGKSYISIDQITNKEQVEKLFAVADRMRDKVESREVFNSLHGYTIAILFYQPSTRTFTSFLAAARHLGARTVAIHGMEQYSSVSKGETLEDTIRSIYQTTAADAIVLRHPDDRSGEIAAAVSPVPIINAGSGKAEHPTQALLDLYTVYHHFERMDNLHIAMVGDLLFGRTIKSLAKLLAVVGKKITITFVSPEELQAPRELIEELKGKVTIHETDDLKKVLPNVDAVYMTRVQKEWFEAAGKLEEYDRLKLKYILTKPLAESMPKNSIILHPLPRVGEIAAEVDANPRQRYFSQMRSGLYVRMALLKNILLG